MKTSNFGSKNNLDEIIYREFVAGDEQKILDLFNHVFNRNWSLPRWTWANKDNPNGHTYFELALNDQEIIGQSAAVPLSFNHEGKIMKTTRVQNVMVHPDFRKRGIFIKTLKDITESLRKRGEDFIITFPNDSSFPAFMKADYSHLFDMFTYNLPIDSLEKNINQNLKFEISEEVVFNQKARDMISSHLTSFKIFNNRCLNYLNWRYHRNSTNKYALTKISRGDEQIGFAVCKPYFDGNSIDLVEFLVENNKNTIESTLNSIFDFYKKTDIKSFNLWSEEHYPMHPILLDLGFRKTEQATHVVYNSLSPRTSQQCDKIGSYYLSMGDSDVY